MIALLLLPHASTIAINVLVATDIEAIVKSMRRSAGSVHFNDLYKVCEHYFGKPRSSGSSHFVFRTPWALDPRVNIQSDKGKGKPYQVRQVLAAIDKLTAIQKAQSDSKSENVKPPGKPPKK
jgi:hypothetical protein